jgi:uncharacterized protein YjbI with pentapeptide repeats
VYNILFSQWEMKMDAQHLLASYESGERAFDGLELTMLNLSGATLSGASFVGAELMMANLSGADLSQADLTRADLRWANLSAAKITSEQLSRAGDLTGATMPNGVMHE